MRFSRSEIAFLAYLFLLVVTGGFGIYANSLIAEHMQIMTGGAALDTLQSGVFSIQAVLGLLLFAILIGLFHFYPMIRQQSRERGELQKMTQSLTAKSATFQQAALTDPLTGLQNRRYFDDALAQYMEEFGRINRPLGIMIVDIDHFKSINDTHGHDVGDEVIKGLADTVREYTRYHDIAARIGGEEFAVVAPNVKLDELNKLANRLRIAVSEMSFSIGNIRLRITISVGIAVWDGKETGARLYKRADGQLYNAKRSGRNRVCA
jgi:diguanylate cyclase (GGDEF)-like protein